MSYIIAVVCGAIAGFCLASILSLNALNLLQSENDRLYSERADLVKRLTALMESVDKPADHGN